MKSCHLRHYYAKGNKSDRKINTVWSHLYGECKIIKFIEIEIRFVVARVWGVETGNGSNWSWVQGFFRRGDINVLKLDYVEDCTTLYIY